MDPVFQLLNDLTVDPFQLDAFLLDPDPLAKVQMTRDDIARLANSGSAPSESAWARCAICADPGFDPLPDPDVPPPPPES